MVIMLNSPTQNEAYASSPPSASALHSASTIEVFDSNGARVQFGSLYRDKKTLIIWIRHFHCGLCLDFVGDLISKVTPTELEQAGAGVVIIGCGEWNLLKPYSDLLELRFPIYADPGIKTYTALGMTRRTLDGGPDDKVPSYIKHSKIKGIVVAIANALKMGKLKGSGDIKQLGGEMVIGPGDQVVYSHRMANTRDHSEVEDLKKIMGIQTS